MKKYVYISTLLLLMSSTTAIVFGQSQIYLSESWTGQGGQMAVFSHNVTETDAFRNVYVAGSTLNAANNNDIILQKFNREGMLLWQQTFNGEANMDDMAADIFVDANSDVYVTGTSIAHPNTGFDLVVLKYKSDGQLIWTKYYDNGGQPTPQDAGIAITGDNNGSIFVTGGSFGQNTFSDYVTLRMNASDGNIQWTQRYDYAHYNDVASTIRLSGSQVMVSGGSQVSMSPNKYEMATLVYDKNTGAQLAERRSSGSGTNGTDEIFDITTDNNGNFYLTGSIVNASTGIDIVVYKLNSNLDIVWQQTFDGYGHTDKGKGIKLDSQGNVYVAGYTETNNEGDNFAILKYSNSGNLIWSREFNGEANLDDRAVQLVIDENDRIYVTGEARNESHSDYQTVGYTTSGDIFAQVSSDGPEGMDDKPSGIAIDRDGNIIVVGQVQVSGGWKNYTVKYETMERPYMTSGGSDNHMKNEIIVKFSPEIVNPEFIDNKATLFRQLSGVIPDSVALKMKLKTGIDFADKRTVKAIKIYPTMTRSETVSISRQGTEVPIPEFWSSLLLTVPGNLNLQTICDSLNTMHPEIYTAQLNYVYTIDAVPDDNNYDTQFSLQQNNVSINAENAWDIERGSSVVRVGIVDTGIDYNHPDFSWDGSNSFEGSVIKGGKDYALSGHPLIQNISIPDGNGHGTSAGSIVGAISNNNSQNNNSYIAGIAGGDHAANQEGVSLYAMKINSGSSGSMDGASIAGAIYDGASSTGYGLHIMNNSYGGANQDNQIKGMVEFAWRNGVTFVASRGNRLVGQPTSIETDPRYPACYNDNWVLNVGASGTDDLTFGIGSRKVSGNGDPSIPNDNGYGSFYGQGMDLIAPGTTALVGSLISGNYTGSGRFSGTSAAAPHATGTAALLMSKHNSTLPGSPANLAPEDVEFLMQRYATPITVDGTGLTGLPVPNAFAGHGRVNAEQTLNMLNYPEFSVVHSGEANSVSESVGVNQTVLLLEQSFGLAAGYYYADRHQFTFNYLIVLPNGTDILDFWPRWSATNGVSAANPVTGETFANFNFTIQGNVASVSVTTFAWKFKTVIGSGQQINTWVPAPPLQIRAGFSLHAHNQFITNTNNLTAKNAMQLYPNPAQDELNVNLNLIKSGQVSYAILDLQGRMIHQGDFGMQSSGNQNIILPLVRLSSGMYVFQVKTDNGTFTQKFIKQ